MLVPSAYLLLRSDMVRLWLVEDEIILCDKRDGIRVLHGGVWRLFLGCICSILVILCVLVFDGAPPLQLLIHKEGALVKCVNHVK